MSKYDGLLRLALIVISIDVVAVPSAAQNAALPTTPVTRRLELGPADYDALIGKLKNAQKRLRSGERVDDIDLMSGGVAIYSVIDISPRRAFLSMNFDKPNIVTRTPDTGLWQNYELVYFHPGASSLTLSPPDLEWKVIVITSDGGLVRVEMDYIAPPPF